MRWQAEISLADIAGNGLGPTWLPLYARLGDEIQREELGKIRVAAWLGPGSSGRLGTGVSLQTWPCTMHCLEAKPETTTQLSNPRPYSITGADTSPATLAQNAMMVFFQADSPWQRCRVAMDRVVLLSSVGHPGRALCQIG